MVSFATSAPAHASNVTTYGVTALQSDIQERCRAFRVLRRDRVLRWVFQPILHLRHSTIFATSDDAGYWVASSNGGVFTYGDALTDGSMAGAKLNGQIIAARGF
jgi:hypothetical protein